MIESMTGYGSGEYAESGVAAASAEIRSVNNRYAEISVRLPRQFAHKEQEAKDLIRKELVRGKISAAIQLDREEDTLVPIKVKPKVVKAYAKMLREVKRHAGIKTDITLEDVLKFSEIFEANATSSEREEAEWQVLSKALQEAITNLKQMRQREGAELKKDFIKRIELINASLDNVERISKQTLETEKQKLRDRVKELVTDETKISRERVEMEIVLLADKMDITEECVRFRSHNKFFLQALEDKESAGRRLNFLLQEQGREANTIASKAASSEISHIVIGLKEELEKIREQMQNIE
jgi:uncharacterized protein (TIGR00255 family)